MSIFELGKFGIESMQSVGLWALLIAAFLYCVHNFFIGELVEYNPPLFPFYRKFLMNLQDKHMKGAKWAIIYKPLGGCLFCFAFWFSIPFAAILLFATHNFAYLFMPYLCAVICAILNKYLNH